MHRNNYIPFGYYLSALLILGWSQEGVFVFFFWFVYSFHLTQCVSRGLDDESKINL